MNDEFNYRQDFTQYSKVYEDQLTFDAKKTMEELIECCIKAGDETFSLTYIPQEYIDNYWLKQKMKLL